jgi:hypothetical protein
MFYLYKRWRNRPPRIGTNVYGHSDVHTILRAFRYPTSRPKTLAIARVFRRIRGRKRREYPSDSWVAERRR